MTHSCSPNSVKSASKLMNLYLQALCYLQKKKNKKKQIDLNFYNT